MEREVNRVSVTVDEGLFERVDRASIVANQSVSQTVNNLLELGLLYLDEPQRVRDLRATLRGELI